MIKVYAETTITRLVKDGDANRRAFGYFRDTGRFVFRGAAGRAGHRRDREDVKVTSNSWEYTGDGHALACWPGPPA